MGLFEFAKNKGEKLKGMETNKAEALKKHLKLLGFKEESLNLSVEDETVKVGGGLEDQEEKEKVLLALGNIFGVAKVMDEVVVKNQAEQATMYTVQRGDTLSKIARDFLGNAMKYPVIFEANRPMLKDPDKIYPGQVLRIPAKKS